MVVCRRRVRPQTVSTRSPVRHIGHQSSTATPRLADSKPQVSRTHFSYLYIQSNISVRAGNGVFGLVGALCLLLHFHCVTERENYYVGLRFCTSVCLTVTSLRVSLPGIDAPFALINVLGMMSRSNKSASFLW